MNVGVVIGITNNLAKWLPEMVNTVGAAKHEQKDVNERLKEFWGVAHMAQHEHDWLILHTIGAPDRHVCRSCGEGAPIGLTSYSVAELRYAPDRDAWPLKDAPEMVAGRYGHIMLLIAGWLTAYLLLPLVVDLTIRLWWFVR